MNNRPVSIVRYRKNHDTVKNAVELCNGFRGLKINDKVLIKPNMVYASRRKKIPLYGVVTTTKVIEDIVVLLQEYGCNDITIGEGAPYHKELDLKTTNGFKCTGITELAKKYGVKLVDFNNGEFKRIDLGPTEVYLSRASLETDFLINVPVLKTHVQTIVSMSLKNLKGCLKQSSKMKFHKTDLDEMIACLNNVLKPNLNIIDGIYSLERGPAASGRAHRTNLIIASQDAFLADIVGTACLGIDPHTVAYLNRYGEFVGGFPEFEDIETKGESIDDVKFPLEWRMMEAEKILADYDIKGVTFQWPGKTLCTNCSLFADAFFGIFIKDNKGSSFDGIEFVMGDKVHPLKESKKVILIGNCSIRNNPDCEKAVKLSGCPVGVGDSIIKVYSSSLGKFQSKKLLAMRMLRGIAEKMGIYEETFPRKFSYDPPDFDRSFYRI